VYETNQVSVSYVTAIVLTARPERVGPQALTLGLTVFLNTRLEAMATVWWIVKAGRAMEATAWKLCSRSCTAKLSSDHSQPSVFAQSSSKVESRRSVMLSFVGFVGDISNQVQP
jgi:hypothetical protein